MKGISICDCWEHKMLHTLSIPYTVVYSIYCSFSGYCLSSSLHTYVTHNHMNIMRLEALPSDSPLDTLSVLLALSRSWSSPLTCVCSTLVAFLSALACLPAPSSPDPHRRTVVDFALAPVVSLLHAPLDDSAPRPSLRRHDPEGHRPRFAHWHT